MLVVLVFLGGSSPAGIRMEGRSNVSPSCLPFFFFFFPASGVLNCFTSKHVEEASILKALHERVGPSPSSVSPGDSVKVKHKIGRIRSSYRRFFTDVIVYNLLH